MAGADPLNAYQKQIQQRQALRVLVVDDMSPMRMLIKSVLKQMGILNVAEASDGPGAISHMTVSPVDLLICDWNMPGMTGLQVLVHVRQELKLTNLPVLMVTAEQSKGQVREALEAGVTSYVVKPFQPTKLREHIEKCLAKRG